MSIVILGDWGIRLSCLIVFHSTHYLLQAEKDSKSIGIPFKLIPIPREISAECGMALSFPDEYLDKVTDYLHEKALKHDGVYRKGCKGLTRLSY